MTKYVLFRPLFVCPYSHKPDRHILDKSFPKNNFCKVVYFEILLLSFIHKTFEQNRDEKARTFSRKRNNVKKKGRKNWICVNSPNAIFLSIVVSRAEVEHKDRKIQGLHWAWYVSYVLGAIKTWTQNWIKIWFKNQCNYYCRTQLLLLHYNLPII